MDSYNDFQRFKDKTGTDSIDFKEMSVSKQQPDLRNNSILKQLSQSRQPDALSEHASHFSFTMLDTVNQSPSNTIINSYNVIDRHDTMNPFTPIHDANKQSDGRIPPFFQAFQADASRDGQGDDGDNITNLDTLDTLDTLEHLSSSTEINNTQDRREISLQDVLRRIALCR